MKSEKSFKNLILVTFLLFNLYYFYRYIYKYNSEGTSPTYSNTPFEWQVLKYFFALIAILLLVYLLLKNNIKVKFGVVEPLLSLIFIFILLKSFIQGSYDFVLKYYFVIPVAYTIYFVKFNNIKDKFICINKFILMYHIIYSALQLLLFYFTGRLPALGYAGGLVRFGGGWDDPNAFSIYLVLPISYILNLLLQNKYRIKQKFKLYLLFIICILLDVLTFSFCGYACLFIALSCIFFKYKKKVNVWIIAFLGIVSLIVLFLLMYDTFISIFTAKFGSLSIHINELKLEIGNNDSVFGFIFGNDKYEFSENYYKIVLFNYGIIHFIIDILLKLSFVYISYKNIIRNKKNIVLYCAFIFILIFTIGQLALPLAIIFPINYFYWIFAFIELKEYREHSKYILPNFYGKQNSFNYKKIQLNRNY